MSEIYVDIFEDKVWCEHCQRHDRCAKRIDGLTEIVRCPDFLAVGRIRGCSNCRFYCDDQCWADPQGRKTDFVGCARWEIAPYLVWPSDSEPRYTSEIAAEDEHEEFVKRGVEVFWWNRYESGTPPQLEAELRKVRASGPRMSELLRATGAL